MPTEHRTVMPDVTRGESRQITCASCNTITHHRVMASRNVTDTYEDPSFKRVTWDDFEIVGCLGCDAVTFRHAHRDSEDELCDPISGVSEGLAEHVRIFPHRVARQRIVPATTPLPRPLGRAYSEVVAAYEQSMILLCAIGIGLCLEAFCRERGVPGKSLYEQIEALFAANDVTREEAGYLHSIREVRNAAAHEVLVPRRGDVDSAMTVLESLLYRHYVVPHTMSEPPF